MASGGGDATGSSGRRTGFAHAEPQSGRLSAIVVQEGSLQPKVTDRDGRVLKPVFIDGPSVGNLYDPCYNFFRELSGLRPRPKQWWNRSKRSSSGFPMKSVLKILFAFISLGHKTTVFLPTKYDDKSRSGNAKKDPEGNVVAEASFNIGKCFVDSPENLRTLVAMGMVEFISAEINFVKHMRERVRQRCGVLVTGDVYGKSGVSNEMSVLSDDDETLVEFERLQFERDAAAAAGDDPQRCEEYIPPSLRGSDNLPISTPIFYAQERYLVIPLDVPTVMGDFPRFVDQIYVGQGDARYAAVRANEQITLAEQYRYLKIIEEMLEKDYPKGSKDREVVGLLAHTLGRENVAEQVKAVESLKKAIEESQNPSAGPDDEENLIVFDEDDDSTDEDFISF